VIDVIFGGEVYFRRSIFDRAPRAYPRSPAIPPDRNKTAGHRLPRRSCVSPRNRPKAPARSPTERCRFPALGPKTSRARRNEHTGGLWRAHFGFPARPFSKSVPADNVVRADLPTDEAVARIQYLHRPESASRGDHRRKVGAGKSVAVRAAVAGLDRDPLQRSSTSPTPRRLPRTVCGNHDRLGATPRFHKAEAITQVANCWPPNRPERHRKVGCS